MYDIHQLVSGPFVWAAFILFFGGILYRVLAMIVDLKKKERFFKHTNLGANLRSILPLITPFAGLNWRRNTVLTTASLVFQICLFVSPIFLLAHVILLDESWNISWWTLPDAMADIMTLIVIAGFAFILVQRLTQRDAKDVTSFYDYVIWVIAAAPFITGFLAYHQLFGYPIVMILHIISGEVMLVAIPFTRLSNLIFSPFIRGETGSESGIAQRPKEY